MAKRKRRRKRTAGDVLLTILLLASIGVFCFAGYNLLKIYLQYKEGRDQYSSIVDTMITERNPDQAPETGGSPGDEAPREEGENISVPISVDFASLKAINDDVIGWIYVEAFDNINYPVTRGIDNDFYLHRNIRKEYLYAGTVFADKMNSDDLDECYTILYGHNMKDGSMFALIDDYGDQSFYDQHPVMYLNTPTKNYRIDIFSCFTTDPVSYVYQTVFASTTDFDARLRSLLAASEVSCQATVSPDDRIVTLSTCTSTGDDVRFVVCGKLTEIG